VKPQPHTDILNQWFRQAHFPALMQDVAHAAAPLLNQLQFKEDAGYDRVADLGNSTLHILNGHSG
jgi:hypothetical protein